MEALTGVSMDAHAVSDEAQYANLIAAMAQGSIPADVLFKANLSRAQERIEETMDASSRALTSSSTICTATRRWTSTAISA